jgi:hypothetical protein
MPTDEDVAALRADGYLSDVITDLRERQGSDDAAAAETAREALVLMAELLRERVDGRDPA